MTSMRYIDFSAPGEANNLFISSQAIPQPVAGEVLIKVEAFGVNRPDILQRKGLYPPPKDASPMLGLEVAGEVVALGDDVESLRVGDKVCALCNGGGYAEYVNVPARQCLPVPQGLSVIEAASLPETFFTVWSNVFMSAKLKGGETFLVHGGSSGIGVTAIQLAKAFGARTLTTAGSDEKCQACSKLGADLAINYRQQDFVEAAKAFLDKKRVDVILDMVGGDYVQRNIAIAGMDARIVNIAYLQGSKVELDLLPVMLKRLQLTGSTLRPRTDKEKALIASQLLTEVWPMLEQGIIKPVIAQVFEWHAIADAHRLMESSQHIGKIVVRVV